MKLSEQFKVHLKACVFFSILSKEHRTNLYKLKLGSILKLVRYKVGFYGTTPKFGSFG